MAQTWASDPILAGGENLSDSMSQLNDALDALKSSFAGSTAPSSPTPVAGQLWYDTDDNVWSIYSGSAWKTIGDADSEYLGLLPLSAGASYPLTGDLHMGSNNIKSVTDPTAAQDAATKNYCDTTFVELAGDTMTGDLTMASNDITMDHDPDADEKLARKGYVDAQVTGGGTYTADIDMDSTYTVTNLVAPSAVSDATTKAYVDDKFNPSTGHFHDGTDSKRVDVDELDTGTSFSGGDILKVAASGTGFDATVMPKGGVDSNSYDVRQSGSDYYDTGISVTFTTTNNSQKVAITASVTLHTWGQGSDMSYFRLHSTDGGVLQTTSSGSLTDGESFFLAAEETVATSGSVTWKVQVGRSGGSPTTQDYEGWAAMQAIEIT